MSVFRSFCLVCFCIFILIPTSIGKCSEHRVFEIVFPDSMVSEVASAERNNISVYDCAELCTKLYSEHCGLFFYNTRTRHCSLYDSYCFCVTLHDNPHSKGYAYVKNPPQPVHECPLGVSINDFYDSDGWVVIQRRTDGSENFNRSWIDYENGFGDFNNEFWLGNKYIHFLTNTRSCEIQVDVQSKTGTTGYRRYNHFSIASDADKYRLNIGVTSTGSIDDYLRNHNRSKFFTMDQDVKVSGCARSFGGGWWYMNCGYVHLNGRPPCSESTNICNRWYNFGCDLKRTEIKIRPA